MDVLFDIFLHLVPPDPPEHVDLFLAWHGSDGIHNHRRCLLSLSSLARCCKAFQLPAQKALCRTVILHDYTELHGSRRADEHWDVQAIKRPRSLQATEVQGGLHVNAITQLPARLDTTQLRHLSFIQTLWMDEVNFASQLAKFLCEAPNLQSATLCFYSCTFLDHFLHGITSLERLCLDIDWHIQRLDLHLYRSRAKLISIKALIIGAQDSCLETIISGIDQGDVRSITIVGRKPKLHHYNNHSFAWLFQRRWPSLKSLRLCYEFGGDVGPFVFDGGIFAPALQELRMSPARQWAPARVKVNEWKRTLRLLAADGRLLVPLDRVLFRDELPLPGSDPSISWTIRQVIVSWKEASRGLPPSAHTPCIFKWLSLLRV